jgi:hypothetical protein
MANRTGNGNQLLTYSPAPASATSPGTPGQVAFDAVGYWYFCYGVNQWGRIGPTGYGSAAAYAAVGTAQPHFPSAWRGHRDSGCPPRNRSESSILSPDRLLPTAPGLAAPALACLVGCLHDYAHLGEKSADLASQVCPLRRSVNWAILTIFKFAVLLFEIPHNEEVARSKFDSVVFAPKNHYEREVTGTGPRFAVRCGAIEAGNIQYFVWD